MSKLIFLDADDTFLTPPYEAVRKASWLLGIRNFPSAAEFIDRNHIEFHLAFPKVFTSKRMMWLCAFAALPFGFFRSYKLYDEVDLENLKKLLDDERVIVVSKNPPSFTRWRLARIKELTGSILGERYIACGPIFKKSTPKIDIIRRIAAERNVALKDCFLVDDSPENIAEAARAGVKCLLIDAPWNHFQREDLLSELPHTVKVRERDTFAQVALGELEGQEKREVVFIAPNEEARHLKLARKRLRKGNERATFLTLHSPSLWNFVKKGPNNPSIEAFRALIKRPDFLTLDIRIVDAKGHDRLLTREEKLAFQPETEKHEIFAAVGFRKFCRKIFEEFGFRFPSPALFNFYYRDRESIVQEILSDPTLESATIEYLRSERISQTEVEEIRRRHLNSIIFHRTYRGCLIGYWILSLLLSKVFRSINTNLDESDKHLEDEYFTIYAPIHRSYLDSAILYMILGRSRQHFPYIVAAEKMYDVWLGRLGSYAGSFFINRKHVDVIYSAIITAHLKQIHTDGASLEVFIEGMRSRSGLTLPPKRGIINSVDTNRSLFPNRKVAIVPVSFVYNKLPESEILLSEVYEDRRKEGKVSLREQADILIRKKRRKSFIQKLKSNYRRLSSDAISDCYVEFGKPVILGDRSSLLNIKLKPMALPQTQDYLNEVMFRISRITPILPSSVVCLGLLASSDHHANHEDIRNFLKLSHRIVSLYKLNERMLFDVTKTDQHIEESLKLPFINRKFKKGGINERWIISITDLDLTRAFHYRNNIFHYFVLPAMLANILTYSKSVKKEELHRYLDHLFGELATKYFLPIIEDSGRFINEILSIFCEAGYIKLHHDTYMYRAETTENSPFMMLSTLAEDFANSDLMYAFSRFRRAFQRVESEFLAQVSMDGEELPAVVRNLSAGGALISCDGLTFDKDRSLVLSITFEEQSYSFKAVVIRVEDFGCGIQFIDPDQIINDLIASIEDGAAAKNQLLRA